MGVINEERPIAASEAIKEPTMADSKEERLPTAIEQEVIVETAPWTDALSTRVDEARLFGNVGSHVAKTISVNVQVPSGEPQDITSSSGMILELLTPSFVDTTVLMTTRIFLQLDEKVVEEDIVVRMVISSHAVVVEALIKQFLAYVKTIVPLLLQDIGSSKGSITKLEDLASSNRCFDATLDDHLKLVIEDYKSG